MFISSFEWIHVISQSESLVLVTWPQKILSGISDRVYIKLNISSLLLEARQQWLRYKLGFRICAFSNYRLIENIDWATVIVIWVLSYVFLLIKSQCNLSLIYLFIFHFMFKLGMIKWSYLLINSFDDRFFVISTEKTHWTSTWNIYNTGRFHRCADLLFTFSTMTIVLVLVFKTVE